MEKPDIKYLGFLLNMNVFNYSKSMRSGFLFYYYFFFVLKAGYCTVMASASCVSWSEPRSDTQQVGADRVLETLWVCQECKVRWMARGAQAEEE